MRSRSALAPLLALILANLRNHLNLTSDMLAFLTGVIAVALVGGLVPAVIAAIVASLFLNYFFTPPLYTFNINEPNNALSLVVFVIVAVVVATIVDYAARRSKQAARASSESDLLVTTAGSILRGEQPLQAVIDRVREAFGMEAVTLLERQGQPREPTARRAGTRSPAQDPGSSSSPRTAMSRFRSARTSAWPRAGARCPPPTAGYWARSPPMPRPRSSSSG